VKKFLRETMQALAGYRYQADALVELENELLHDNQRMVAEALGFSSPGSYTIDQVVERIKSMREALRAIADSGPNHCSSFTGLYSCRDKYSGKSREDRTIADGWCESCVAADGLGLPTGRPSE
jgi:hypothetical protein